MLKQSFKSSAPTRDELVLELLNSSSNTAPENPLIIRPAADPAVPSPVTVDDYMLFNGINQGIRFPQNFDWAPREPRSIELDVLVDPAHPNNIGNLINLAGTAEINGSWNISFFKNPQPNIRYRQFIDGVMTERSFVPTGLTLQYNQWYRIMVTIEGNLVIGYLNGVEMWRFNSPIASTVPGDLAIGCDSSLSPSLFFQGRLRNLRISDSVFEPK